MRITLDTGDLREVANSAAGAATQVRTVRTDVSNARNSVSLNTREDATLRRTDPDEDANRILRELDRLEGEYREISKSYDRQADAVDRAAASSWRPSTIAIEFTMPSWGQLRPPSPFGVIAGGVSAITSRAVPHFVGAARSTLSSIGRTASSARQRAFGFVRSRWDNAKQGAWSLFDKLKETASRAWDRVWSRTQQILRDVISGVKDIVAFSGNVITHAWETATTTAGRWISTGARNAWNFLGRNWDHLKEGADWIFTAIDVAEIIQYIPKLNGIGTKLVAFASRFGQFSKFAKFAKWLGKLALPLSFAVAAIDFVRYGVADARFWESAFDLVSAVGIVVLLGTGPLGVAAGLALLTGVLIGKGLSELFVMPFIDRHYDGKTAEIERETDRALSVLFAEEFAPGSSASLGTGAEPGVVADWWSTLSDEQRYRLVDEHPDLLANTDGIPLDVRYGINRAALRSFVASNDANDELVALSKVGDAQILLFDPNGDGRIAVAHGDLVTAQDIAVVVPGIGNSLGNFSSSDALALRGAAGEDVATIQWLGYDTPSGLELGALSDPASVSAGRARQWGSALASFTDGLRVTSNAEVSVVAHSYGTVLATEAARSGMDVDRVVLMGSPGVPADDVSIFNGADVFAVRNVGDYVSTGSVHGTDPTDPEFGAEVLRSNDWSPTPSRGNAHSTYLDPGSDSLASVVGAIGSSRVGDDGLITQRIVHEDGSADVVTTPTF